MNYTVLQNITKTSEKEKIQNNTVTATTFTKPCQYSSSARIKMNIKNREKAK